MSQVGISQCRQPWSARSGDAYTDGFEMPLEERSESALPIPQIYGRDPVLRMIDTKKDNRLTTSLTTH